MKKIIYILFFVVVQTVFAQEEEIKNENVRVEFSFNPTLMDAFKLKANPNKKDSVAKQKVNYKIQSVPVNSDYIPQIKKTKYALNTGKRPAIYDSWIDIAAGLYGNTELDAFLDNSSEKTLFKSIALQHQNHQNGISDKRVDNQSWQTALEITFGNKTRRHDWTIDIVYQRDQNHWYGLSPNAILADYQNKDFKQVYQNFKVGGDVRLLKQKHLKRITPSLSFFTDDYQSTEVNLQADADLDYKLFKKNINSTVHFQFLNGGFDQGYNTPNNIDYRLINLIYEPNYQYQKEGFTVNIGFGLGVNLDNENSESNVIAYPKIGLTYAMIPSVMTLKGGLRGDFKQNTYQNITEVNPFVSPSLNILATRTPLDIYAGLQGALTNKISYEAEVSYATIKDQLLFVNNPLLPTAAEAYQLGNTFNAVYDDVNQLSIKGNIKANITDQFSITGLGSIYQYNATQEAWNLPSFNLQAIGAYTYNKWLASSTLNVVGSRPDLVNGVQVDLPTYVDLNVKTQYQFTQQWSADVRLYNILGNSYDRYVNYEVQGFQALVGVHYKF